VNLGERNALDLTFASVGGRTVLTRRRYRWPLLIGRVFTDPTRPGLGSVTIQNAAGTVIPGDRVRQQIRVVDGGSAVVRGQGATLVSGIPCGDVAVEDTRVGVDASSRLLLDASPRILTPHARYRQHTQVCVEPGGRAVLVDTVVLHPDLTDERFGSYESSVAVTAPDQNAARARCADARDDAAGSALSNGLRDCVRCRCRVRHNYDGAVAAPRIAHCASGGQTCLRCGKRPAERGWMGGSHRCVGWRHVAGKYRRSGRHSSRREPTKSVAQERNSANTSWLMSHSLRYPARSRTLANKACGCLLTNS